MGKAERLKAAQLRALQAPPPRIKCRLVTIPEAVAKVGFEVPGDYLYFGFDWRTLDVVVIEKVQEKKPEDPNVGRK